MKQPLLSKLYTILSEDPSSASLPKPSNFRAVLFNTRSHSYASMAQKTYFKPHGTQGGSRVPADITIFLRGHCSFFLWRLGGALGARPGLGFPLGHGGRASGSRPGPGPRAGSGDRRGLGLGPSRRSGLGGGPRARPSAGPRLGAAVPGAAPGPGTAPAPGAAAATAPRAAGGTRAPG